MKKNFSAWLVIALCLCCFLVYGQSAKRVRRPSAVGKNTPELFVPTQTINVDLSLQKPPVYVASGQKTKLGGGVPDKMKNWLVSEISFGISLRGAKRTRLAMLEEVNVELYLFVPGQARDNLPYRWLYGCQKLHCLLVESDQGSRRYWASLLFPGQYVYMHIPSENNHAFIRSIEGVVVISDRENNVLGRRAFGYRSKLAPARVKKLLDAVNELQQSKTGCIALWPREKTPWAWLDADRFELPLTAVQEIKSASPKKEPVMSEEKDEE